MLVFEPIASFKSQPIILSIFSDKSRSFKQLYHFHAGVEMIYVHNGTGRIVIGQHIYDVNPGTFIFVKPLQPHFLQMDIREKTPYVRSMIKYEPDFISKHLKDFPEVCKFHNSLWHDPLIRPVQYLECTEPMDHFLKETYMRVYSDSASNWMEGRIMFLTSLFFLLQQQWKESRNTNNIPYAFSPAVIQILDWVDQHYEQEFQLELLAQAIHLSPNYVSSLFRKATGKTIMEYLTIRRVREACLLLKTTGSPVHVIGEQCGWPNFAYFCKVFKKQIGMTPNAYRHA
jgi:YesN/AraC family two-component response regulator